MIVGYFTAVCVGLVDFTPVLTAHFFTLPNFHPAKFDLNAILMMLPVLLVITAEHVGHQLVTDNIVGRDLHRSLLGDDLSTAISGMLGSVPTTTYGENIGVMAVTGVYSVQVIAGITFLLYGMIGTSGLRVPVDKKVDYAKNRNLILTSVVFVSGLSGLSLTFGAITVTGMTLAAVVAVVLSLLFYLPDRAKLMNDD